MDNPEKRKDIWDWFDQRDREKAARSTCRRTWDELSNKLWRLWDRHLAPDQLRWKVVAFFQRRIRGFDDSELWSLDYTILKFILPRLKRYRASNRIGWPGPEAIFDIKYEDFQALSVPEREILNAQSLEEWDRMLDKMIRAIELQIEHDGIFLKPNPDWKEGDSRRGERIGSPELEAEHKEGWNLFVKWFHALWD